MMSSIVISGPVPINTTGNSVQHIEHEHAQIHLGNHYFYVDSITLNAGVSQDYMITVPVGVFPHLLCAVSGSAITEIRKFEGTDKNGTTLQTTFNNNRNSSNTSTVTVHKGTSGGTTDGVLLCLYHGGSSSGAFSQGTSFNRDQERILKANTKYIIRVTSQSASNLITINLSWYHAQ